jgi:hypothetical protein
LKRRNPDMRIGVGGCVAQLLERASWLARPSSTSSSDAQLWPRSGARAPLARRTGPLRRPGSSGDDLRHTTLVGRPWQRDARLRHGDGRLQPCLQLLRRASDPGARGLPCARRNRGRGAIRCFARIPGGGSARADGERLSGGETDFPALLERSTRWWACSGCGS